jgi:DNA invertase Pin-like site-specific DNA recombinase
MEEKPKMKAAIYVRVSTHEQTVEQQIYPCQKWCQLNDYDTVIFAEEGVSGAKTSRTQLDLMLQRMRKGEFHAIVVWKLDRLGRNTQHLLQLSEEFRNKRVKLVCVTQNIDTERPEGRMFFTIIASFAELEREFTMERIKLAMQTKIRKGIKLGRPKGCKDKTPRRRAGYLLYHLKNPHKGDSFYKRQRREEKVEAIEAKAAQALENQVKEPEPKH